MMLTPEGRARTIVLGKLDLLLALVVFVLLAAAYWLTLLSEALALLVLVLIPVAVVSRFWNARRGQLEYGLFRHPFRRDLRPLLLQCLNRWLFWAAFGAAILAGTFAVVPAQIGSLLSLPLPHRIPYPPLLIALGLAALVMAALCLVPHRRVQVASNVLVAVGTVFLAIQLVQVYTSPTDPVVIDPPLAGEWTTVAGGRSVLLSHHYAPATPQVRHALDFVRLVDGRGYEGDPQQPESWYGFGQPVLAPADGIVVSVNDIHPDEPIGQTGVEPPYGNHIVLDIGESRYAVMAHLAQGSARVSVGERVRLGQEMAAVGDSGNSLWPHLHFHVQASSTLDEQARTVPVVFRDVVLLRNGGESTPAEADLRRGDRSRRV